MKTSPILTSFLCVLLVVIGTFCFLMREEFSDLAHRQQELMGEIGQSRDSQAQSLKDWRDQSEKSISDANQRLEQLSHDVEQLKKDLASYQGTLSGFGSDAVKARQTIDELDAYRRLNQRQQQEASTLLNRLEYSLRVTMQSDSGSSKAVKGAFSDFKSPTWMTQVNDYTRRLFAAGLAHRPILDGKGGVDTYNDETNADLMLNGIFFRSIEKYDVFNGKPNHVTVLAPGLVDLEDQSLEIVADKDFDSVELDGCLKWQKIGKPVAATTWKATDRDGATATVKISSGVATKIQLPCNSDYFLAEDRLAVASFWKNTAVQQGGASAPPHLDRYRINPPPKTYPDGQAGVGISFRIADDGSLFVRGVLPDTPAEKAGLKKGDRIIEVDGQPVKGMSAEAVGNLIRGQEGTEVKLIYRPYASSTPNKSVVLKRENLGGRLLP